MMMRRRNLDNAAPFIQDLAEVCGFRDRTLLPGSIFERFENSFWAVWKPELRWPELYASEKAARAGVQRMAKSDPGAVVHLMRVESKETVQE